MTKTSKPPQIVGGESESEYWGLDGVVHKKPRPPIDKTTLLEKVARAIAAERNSPGWQAYLGTAYDALKAAREPTDAMVNAGRDAWTHHVTPIWQAMIDAALEEEPTT